MNCRSAAPHFSEVANRTGLVSVLVAHLMPTPLLLDGVGGVDHHLVVGGVAVLGEGRNTRCRDRGRAGSRCVIFAGAEYRRRREIDDRVRHLDLRHMGVLQLTRRPRIRHWRVRCSTGRSIVAGSISRARKRQPAFGGPDRRSAAALPRLGEARNGDGADRNRPRRRSYRGSGAASGAGRDLGGPGFEFGAQLLGLGGLGDHVGVAAPQNLDETGRKAATPSASLGRRRRAAIVDRQAEAAAGPAIRFSEPAVDRRRRRRRRRGRRPRSYSSPRTRTPSAAAAPRSSASAATRRRSRLRRAR